MVRRIFAGSAAGLVVLLAVVAVRAVFVSSRQVDVEPVPPIQLEEGAVLGRLSRALQFRTVAYAEPNAASARAQAEFVAWIRQAFPDVHRVLMPESIDAGALLYTWHGSKPELPALLLLAHMDVVPVEDETQWTHPPFSGVIADGHVWGRGAIDDKGSMVAILEAVQSLVAAGAKPERTILLAFGHDEEVGGKGAQAIAKVLQERGTKIDAVLDEGGIIVQGAMQGVSAPVALVGIAEKGYVSVTLRSSGEGGHSSMPPPVTHVGRVSRAIARVQAHPFPTDLRGATEEMFEFLAPEMQPAMRLLATNLWLFEPMIAWQASSSPSLNAMLRTTLAPTLIAGGVKENVIASSARAVVNARILPGDTIQDVLAHIKQVTDDPELDVTPGPIQSEPSPISATRAVQFTRLCRAIRGVYADVIVAPYLVVAATDARHYRDLTPNIYRFFPVRLKQQDLSRIHGVDERIASEDYLEAIRFYTQVLKSWGQE